MLVQYYFSIYKFSTEQFSYKLWQCLLNDDNEGYLCRLQL